MIFRCCDSGCYIIRIFKFVWEILPIQPTIQTKTKNQHLPFFSNMRTFFKNGLHGAVRNCNRKCTMKPYFWKMLSSSRKGGCWCFQKRSLIYNKGTVIVDSCILAHIITRITLLSMLVLICRGRSVDWKPAVKLSSWSRHTFSHRRVLFCSLFRPNLPKMTPRTKNGLERRVTQFHTICDKNQLLNINIEKVTAFLVLRSWDAVPLGQVVPPGSDASCSLES